MLIATKIILTAPLISVKINSDVLIMNVNGDYFCKNLKQKRGAYYINFYFKVLIFSYFMV